MSLYQNMDQYYEVWKLLKVVDLIFYRNDNLNHQFKFY